MQFTKRSFSLETFAQLKKKCNFAIDFNAKTPILPPPEKGARGVLVLNYAHTEICAHGAHKQAKKNGIIFVACQTHSYEMAKKIKL